MNRLIRYVKDFYQNGGIRAAVFVSFTFSALVAITLTGITFYARFTQQLETTLSEENQMIVEQAGKSLNTYLSDMIRLSDSISLQVIKNIDVSSIAVSDQLKLLYDTNSGYIKNITLFAQNGEIIATAPPATLKQKVDVTQEPWFQVALSRLENLHFSMPQVQRTFLDNEGQYNWVVSLSTAAEITDGKTTRTGVLMINLQYRAIAEHFKNVTLSNDGYVYLVNADGEIIYHPQHQLINSGLATTIPLDSTGYRGGEYTIKHEGERYQVVLRSVGYTGWHVVGVIPRQGLDLSSIQDLLFIGIIFLLYFIIITLINSYISNRLTDPIQKLEESVQAIENGTSDAEIYVGGSKEIAQLGKSVQSMVDIMRRLTDEIVIEQTKKQKSELNALQAQINPHFLYNTLDIIVWMIEKGQSQDALTVVSALAKFFRLSLSKGRNITPAADELEHVRNYLMIQSMRYKNKFTYEIKADPDVLQLATVKLVLQPIVENAVLHGMDFITDDDGEILIEALREGDDLVFRVSDNGLGMMPETIEQLMNLRAPAESAKNGSGIGVRNVHERIMLYFGEEYGVSIESEPDEGTVVTLRMRAVPYSEMEEER